jgi:hypothetical protein
MKYFKTFALKIKIIANRADDKDIKTKTLGYQSTPNKVRSSHFY